MKDELLLSQLEALAHKMGITIRHFKFIRDESSGRGGLCRIRGKYVLFLDSQAPTREKIGVIIDTLKQFDLGNIPVEPSLYGLLKVQGK